MPTGLITFFRETTDARGLSWLRVCERAGGSRQRVLYALRNYSRGSAVLCVRFADLLGLDRRDVLDRWLRETLAFESRRRQRELESAFRAPPPPPCEGDASMKPKPGGRPRKK